MDQKNLEKCFVEVGQVIADHERFVIMSHVRPDGDAIGSQIALGFSLMAMGKTVFLVNEDGVPESLVFLTGSEKVSTPPAEPLDIEVAIALDTATQPRLGAGDSACSLKGEGLAEY